ncbi:MAG: 3'-5' exonuclease [Oscillospiraceae bacterium]|nr:3'-5' exonuclease [Oscillospiraceae bacterium]
MSDIKNDFIKLRCAVIQKDFGRMNDMQFKAVVTAKGPLLVLAGAGSGKTTVLVNRIACLVKYGSAYDSKYVPDAVGEYEINMAREYIDGSRAELEPGVFSLYAAKPWEILAITFTNKAAGELKERIAKMLGDNARDMWAGTFHSICAKILRRYGDRIGYTSHFTIYDTDDQKRLMKEVMKHLNIEEKMMPVRSILNEISHAKDNLITCEEFKEQHQGDERLSKMAAAYGMYQRMLKNADAMDFDDIIVNTVRLFETNEDVLEYYQNKFKYIMVDEYQDTNHAQYMLVSRLAEKNRNICVVGDDDQSIYRFRGATIANIMNFEDEYKDATVIRLEQNYRSTTMILDAANAVISHNTARKGKNLWTDNGEGDKIFVRTLPDEREEARFVVDQISSSVKDGGRFCDNAILYRMNAQSNAIENVMARSGIPYRVIGGYRFYERKEIRDVIAYLSVINNHDDTIRLRRIINEPKRGIGEVTISNASEIAEGLGIPIYEVLKHVGDYPAIAKSAKKIVVFTNLIDELTEMAESASMNQLVEAVAERSGYMASLEAQGFEALDRIDNVKELSSSIALYESENEETSLSGFLEEIALVNDIDKYDADSDAVVLMTVHSAKGLEFPNVFLVGWEEGMFPGNQSIYGGPEEIEEERRLAYVAITRAKKRLYISNAYTRMLYGQTNRNLPSRFLKEIPQELCDIEAKKPLAESVGQVTFKHASPSKEYAAAYAERMQESKSKASTELYSVGQRVKHKVFKDGTVLSATRMGNDVLLEVAFDDVGTKKIMSNFAKLEKL